MPLLVNLRYSHTGSLTGSLVGTSSYANNALSASFVSGAYTAQWSPHADTSDTASFVSGAYTAKWALSSSYALSSSWAPGGGAFDATVSRNYTGSLQGTASIATGLAGALNFAWGRISVNFSSMSLLSRNGIQDIKKIATGAFEVHWSPAFNSATSYAVTCTPAGIAGSFAVANLRQVFIPLGSQSAATTSFQCVDETATTALVKDASAYNIVAWGM